MDWVWMQWEKCSQARLTTVKVPTATNSLSHSWVLPKGDALLLLEELIRDLI